MITRQLDLSTWQKCLDELPNADEYYQLYILSCFRVIESGFKKDVIKKIDAKKITQKKTTKIIMAPDNSKEIQELKERIKKTESAMQHPFIAVEVHDKLHINLSEYKKLLKELESK